MYNFQQSALSGRHISVNEAVQSIVKRWLSGVFAALLILLIGCSIIMTRINII